MGPEEVHGVLNSVISVEGNWVEGKSSESTAGDVLGVRVLSPESFAYTIDADTTRWARSESASSRYKPYIRIRPSSNINNTRFINVLYPLTESTWSSKPTIDLLGNTEDACGLRVHQNGTQDHIIKYGEAAEVTIGEYIFKGEAASIIKESGTLTKLFAVNTSSLYESGGARLLASSLINKSYEAVYSGNTLSLHSEDDLSGLKLYAPGITTVTLNTTPVTFIQDGEYIIISNGDTQSPTRPENLNAQVFYDRIEISWSPSTDNRKVEGYHLYRNDSLKVDLTATNYVDRDFSVSKQYRYKVLAYDAMGNTSPFSNVDTVTTLDLRPVLAYYKFDYNVADSSGNNYDGEIQGNPVFGNGIDSIGLIFDGVGDYILVNWNNPPVQGENASFTFCSWIRTNIDTTQWVFGERDSYNAFTFGTYTSSGETRLQLAWYDGTNRVYFNRNWRPADKGFMHIAGTYDASTKHVSLYINGDKVLCDTTTKPSGIIDLTPLTMGRGRYTNEAQYWNGTLDDIRIYEVALSEQEIRAIFDEFNPDSINNLGPDSSHIFFLYPNNPNPFNTTTTINYLVNQAGNVKFAVYDILGREIKVLFEGYISAGPHSAEWDGTDSKGTRVPSGTYFYQIRGEDGVASGKKMILIK
jgi:chitodextrinase